MKVIKFDTPKGQFQIPLKLVAEHRAESYHPKDDVGFKEEVDFVMNDDFEGIDWLINNTDFDEWTESAIKLNDDINVTEDDFWCSSDGFEIVDTTIKQRNQ